MLNTNSELKGIIVAAKKLAINNPMYPHSARFSIPINIKKPHL
jgi:hypothetical protein